MPYVQITSFQDLACTKVHRTAELTGRTATQFLESFRNLKGWDVKEGDLVCGVRIDRIGSEDQSTNTLGE